MKERILQIIENKGLNKNKFYSITGLSNGFLDKSGSIGVDKLEKILNSFPDIDSDWLITGKGNMLKSEKDFIQISEQTESVPVYNIDFTASDINVFNDNIAEVIGYLNIPELKGSERVIIARGDSMLGVIDSGDFIGIKKINDFTFFNYGSPYAIVTEDYRLLKFIRKSDNSENIILRSNNPEYDDIELPKDKILELYLITACLPFSKIKMFM